MGWSWERVFEAVGAMVGAILLSLPLTIIYLRTKPAREFDSAVLFSIIILATMIAGILVVVEGSVARALSLAGVVSAVRFRSSLNDSNDAVYLLGAIAVGLAAGSHALDIGLVISVVLYATLLVLWNVRLDAVERMLVPEANQTHHGHHEGHDHAVEASHHAATSTAPVTTAAAHSDAPTLEALPSPRVGYFVIQTAYAERARLLVEMVLERETKRWRLDGSTGNGNGNGNGNSNWRGHKAPTTRRR